MFVREFTCKIAYGTVGSGSGGSDIISSDPVFLISRFRDGEVYIEVSLLDTEIVKEAVLITSALSV